MSFQWIKSYYLRSFWLFLLPSFVIFGESYFGSGESRYMKGFLSADLPVSIKGEGFL